MKKVIVKILTGQEYNYLLKIDGKDFLYMSFPFIKGQDVFNIISSNSTMFEVELDEATYNIHASKTLKTTAIHHGVNNTYELSLIMREREHSTAFFNGLTVEDISEVFDIGGVTLITNGDLIKVTHVCGDITRVKIFKYVETGSIDDLQNFEQNIIYVGEE